MMSKTDQNNPKEIENNTNADQMIVFLLKTTGFTRQKILKKNFFKYLQSKMWKNHLGE